MRRLGLVIALVVAGPRLALAIAGRAWLERMTAGADVIVLADVIAVEAVDGGRIATAHVVKEYKGDAGESVQFTANPLWMCDMSWAEPGEQALLFLQRVSVDGFVPTVACAQTESRRCISVSPLQISGANSMPFVTLMQASRVPTI